MDVWYHLQLHRDGRLRTRCKNTDKRNYKLHARGLE